MLDVNTTFSRFSYTLSSPPPTLMPQTEIPTQHACLSSASHICSQCRETTRGKCASADYTVLKRGGVLGGGRFGVPDTLMPERRQCGIVDQVVAVVLYMALGLELELVDESVYGVMMSIGLMSESVAAMLMWRRGRWSWVTGW
jgi:hypothetical protein